jgi:ABC-type iron transport system FetAB ATPase subunit
MVLEHVRQAYGEHVVYEDLNLTIERGQRTVLVGPNGAGKSTLLKILAGLLPLEAGTRTEGHNVNVGYFAQHRTDTLDVRRTVLDEAMDGASGVSEQSVRTVLGSFLFRGDDVFKNVGILSGGEKSRLALVKLLLQPHHPLAQVEVTAVRGAKVDHIPTTHVHPTHRAVHKHYVPALPQRGQHGGAACQGQGKQIVLQAPHTRAKLNKLYQGAHLWVR